MSGTQQAEAVLQQVRTGRILPLGGPEDGVWITEAAAAPVLRHAAEAVGGVRMRSLRIGPAHRDEPGGSGDRPRPAVPPPATALPYGPLRVTASFDTVADRPLPESAALVRRALAEAADARLGLAVTTVDLEISGLLDGDGARGAPGEESPAVPAEGTGYGRPAAAPYRTSPGQAGRETHREEQAGPAYAAWQAARSVPGVTALIPGAGRAPAGAPAARAAQGIRLRDTADPPRRQVQVRCAVHPGRRVLDVALAVRAAVAAAVSADAPGPVAVGVLVVAVEE